MQKTVYKNVREKELTSDERRQITVQPVCIIELHFFASALYSYKDHLSPHSLRWLCLIAHDKEAAHLQLQYLLSHSPDNHETLQSIWVSESRLFWKQP